MKLNWTMIVNISRPQQSIICILKAAIQIDTLSIVECVEGERAGASGRAPALNTIINIQSRAGARAHAYSL